MTAKKRKLELPKIEKLAFYYGVDDFAEVSRGFYIDKTQYISHLETYSSQVFVFFSTSKIWEKPVLINAFLFL